MLEGVASRIERDIEVRTSSKERALLSEYLRISRRRGNRAVIALDGKNSLLNATATATLEDGDVSVISGYAKAVMSSGRELNCEVSLQGGPGISTLEVSPVTLSAANVGGAIVVVRPHSPTKERPTQPPHSDEVEPQAALPDAADRIVKHLDGTSMGFKRTLSLPGRLWSRSVLLSSLVSWVAVNAGLRAQLPTLVGST